MSSFFGDNASNQIIIKEKKHACSPTPTKISIDILLIAAKHLA